MLELTPEILDAALTGWSCDSRALAAGFTELVRYGCAPLIASYLDSSNVVYRRVATLAFEKNPEAATESPPVSDNDLVVAAMFTGQSVPEHYRPIYAMLLRNPSRAIQDRALRELPEVAEGAILAALFAPGGPVTLRWVQYAARALPHDKLPAIAGEYPGDSSDAATAILRALVANRSAASAQAMLGLIEKANARHETRWLWEQLADMGDVALEPLRERYRVSRSVRRDGAGLLRQWGSESAVPLLSEALSDPYREVRQAAALNLARLGPAATGILLNVARDSNAVGQEEAVDVLGERRDPVGTDALIGLTRDPRVGRRAIAALGRIGTPLSTEALRELLLDPDRSRAEAAATALGHSTTPEAAAALISSIRQDPRPTVRLAALDTIGEWFQSAYERPLSRDPAPFLLDTLLSLVRDPDPAIVAAVYRHLSLFGKEIVELCRENAVQCDDEGARLALMKRIGALRDGRVARDNRFKGDFLMLELVPDDSPLQPEPPRPIRDDVTFTVVAGETVRAGETAQLDVYAHPDQVESVVEAARKEFGYAVRHKSKAGVPVDRDAVLTVRVTLPELGFSDADQLVWRGRMGNATFLVPVPPDQPLGRYAGRVDILIADLAIARLQFLFEVGSQHRSGTDLTTAVQHIRHAFASYASEDRLQVLARIQGMQKLAPELDVFLDVLTVRSGEDWKRRLEQEIRTRDVLYLFWSPSAMASEWVNYEWRYALETRGLGFIDPIPLAPPEKAPPPEELKHKHFGDWTLRFSA